MRFKRQSFLRLRCWKKNSSASTLAFLLPRTYLALALQSSTANAIAILRRLIVLWICCRTHLSTRVCASLFTAFRARNTTVTRIGSLCVSTSSSDLENNTNLFADINKEHGERALPLMKKSLSLICTGRDDKFTPDMALSIFPKLMNTM